MFDLPTDLPADIVPLAWLIGVWEGSGVIEYATPERTLAGEFVHRVSFSHDGGPYLNYSAEAWLTGVDADGDVRRRLVSEVGYWRLSRPATDDEPGPALLPAPSSGPARTADDVELLRNAAGGFDIEVLLVQSDGIGELYLGQVRGPRIDLATDYVVRTAGTRPYAAATRMYGLVEDHLLWAWDIAALGRELGSHASARLSRSE